MALFPFDNQYARLPDRLFARHKPTAVRSPKVLRINEALAGELGLDAAALADKAGLAALAGNAIPEGAEPLAQAYAGHQFGNFVPQLGDGRAILLGEVVDKAGVHRDIQLKGSGPTPFSRRGDGRAAIGPVLREYLVSEAMHALGVPTTRSLAAVTTGEDIRRDTMLQGAVLTRVATSHVRVGTFQFFAVRQDADALQALADYVIQRHYPDAAKADNPVLAMLHAVMKRQATLVAEWLRVGFIHGVMNTDNTTISGETIDYGPCAFLDAFDSATVFSSIDRQGRYAYGAQPQIIGWNMVRLAETLVPIIDTDQETAVKQAQAAIEQFSALMEAEWLGAMRKKLGMLTEQEGDRILVTEFLYAMQAGNADFTNTFRAVNAAAGDDAAYASVRECFSDPARFDDWAPRWRERLAAEDVDPTHRAEVMRLANPAYVPRNHLVEEALAAASTGDLSAFDELLAVVSNPCEEQQGRERYTEPAPPSDEPYRTFCGT